MTLKRWDPFRILGDIPAAMNRLFNSFFGRPVRAGLMERPWAPVMDMYETKDEVVVTAEFPGVREKEVNVSITGDVLTLKGERAQANEVKPENYHCLEQFDEKFERNIPLPMPVQADKVKATYRNGMLEVKLRRQRRSSPRRSRSTSCNRVSSGNGGGGGRLPLSPANYFSSTSEESRHG
jgi:HSP20 family protein